MNVIVRSLCENIGVRALGLSEVTGMWLQGRDASLLLCVIISCLLLMVGDKQFPALQEWGCGAAVYREYMPGHGMLMYGHDAICVCKGGGWAYWQCSPGKYVDGLAMRHIACDVILCCTCGCQVCKGVDLMAH